MKDSLKIEITASELAVLLRSLQESEASEARHPSARAQAKVLRKILSARAKEASKTHML